MFAGLRENVLRALAKISKNLVEEFQESLGRATRKGSRILGKVSRTISEYFRNEFQELKSRVPNVSWKSPGIFRKEFQELHGMFENFKQFPSDCSPNAREFPGTSGLISEFPENLNKSFRSFLESLFGIK